MHDEKHLCCMYLSFKPVKINPPASIRPRFAIYTLTPRIYWAMHSRRWIWKLWYLTTSGTTGDFKSHRHTSQPEQPQQSTVVERRGCVFLPVGRTFPRQFFGSGSVSKLQSSKRQLLQSLLYRLSVSIYVQFTAVAVNSDKKGPYLVTLSL